jgi:hypothetical protein
LYATLHSKHAKRHQVRAETFSFNREVNVTWGIDDIDAMFVETALPPDQKPELSLLCDR